MFMVSMEFFSAKGDLLGTCTRPASTVYVSPISRAIRQVAFAVPYAIGWYTERQTATLSCFDQFTESASDPLGSARVTLSHPRLQVYSASVRLEAQLTGLRYYMHHWFMTGAVVGVVDLTLLQLICYVGVIYARGGGAAAGERSDGGTLDRGRRAGSDSSNSSSGGYGGEESSPRDGFTSAAGSNAVRGDPEPADSAPDQHNTFVDVGTAAASDYADDGAPGGGDGQLRAGELRSLSLSPGAMDDLSLHPRAVLAGSAGGARDGSPR